MLIFLVAHGVPLQFGDPKLLVVCRRRAVLAAAMTMPEAAVYKHCNAMTYKNYVRMARKILSMNAKSVTHPMKFRPHSFLR
jgi:hypothetical protein